MCRSEERAALRRGLGGGVCVRSPRDSGGTQEEPRGHLPSSGPASSMSLDLSPGLGEDRSSVLTIPVCGSVSGPPRKPPGRAQLCICGLSDTSAWPLRWSLLMRLTFCRVCFETAVSCTHVWDGCLLDESAASLDIVTTSF